MKLLFVYNANSGKLSNLLDMVHKLISPSTYKCTLCILTHNTFLENNSWKKFRSENKVAMEFYHKDQFEAAFPNVNINYPTVLKLKDNEISTVLNADVLNKFRNVEELIDCLKLKL